MKVVLDFNDFCLIYLVVSLVPCWLIPTRCFYTFVGSKPELMLFSSQSIYEAFRVTTCHPNGPSCSLFYGLFYLRNKDTETYNYLSIQ